MPSEDLLPSILPSHSAKLRHQINENRGKIIKDNYNTQFVQTASALADFRRATAGFVGDMDDDTLADLFQKTVQFTSYDLYAPLIARLFEKPRKASVVANLLAPGYPEFVLRSSATTGGSPKYFPRYTCASRIRASNARSSGSIDPNRRRTKAYVYNIRFDRMEVESDNDHPGATMYLSTASASIQRVKYGLDPEMDKERMGTIILDHVAPYAALFIKHWRSLLLVHALFAVGSRSLEIMDTLFINTFVDMIRCIDMEFDMVIDCIGHGTVPDLDGTAGLHHYLQSNIFPDPERAAELRRIGRPSSRPGWCADVWPHLRSVAAISTGCFSSSVPLARWFLGPGVRICPLGFGSTEAAIGAPYNRLESNQYKVVRRNIIEFLDISQGESIDALAQLWEVELGKRYELVVTTPNGLWRYRLGDLVEICGFDPTDGVPIIQFVERRNMVIRHPAMVFSEEDLVTAMSSLPPSMLVRVVDWTATLDERRFPVTVGFFIELASDEVPDLALAPQRILDGLSQVNKKVARALTGGIFRTPTIRVVQPGTFHDFRQLKLDEGSENTGQIKVPAALPKAEYVTWFSDRVMQEL